VKTFLTVVIVLAILLAGAVVVAYSGIVEVSAVGSQSGIVDWFLETTRDRSVDSRAEKIAVPDLGDPARLTEGLEHYHTMCATCHGAPGLDASEIGQGLNPTPPNLTRHRFAGERAAEAFWIIQNGIRMTGMPAFGPTHTDEQIWDIVAFLRKMHELTPEQYAQMVSAAGLPLQPGGDEDEHAAGAADGTAPDHDAASPSGDDHD
jgi:mono/diheme cytochrome c family protein